MKTKFSRRILAFVLAFALVVPMFVFNASAATKELTFNFADSSLCTSIDTNQQVWESNGITLTNTKGKSTTNVNNYTPSGHIRIYKNSDVTIECKGMTKIVFTCTNKDYAKVPTGLTNATATTSGTTLTITLNSAMDSFSFNCNGSQIRATKMVVTTQIDDAAPTISLNGDNFVAIDGTTTITPTATNLTENIVWTSSNNDVATVNNGVVTGVSTGEVEITASANGVSASTNVKVFPAAGELTIAEALKVCEVAGTTNSPYAYWTTGVITECEFKTDKNYYVVTIFDGENSIVAYGITGDKEIIVGDEITVTGYLVNYNNTTKEFATGSTFVKIENEVTETIRAELNEIAAKMSLAYKYEANFESVVLPSTQTYSDVLNREFTGRPQSTSYGDWSGKAGTSGAIYAGNSAGDANTIQIRTNNNNSGIVTTTSGGTIKSITINWNTTKTTDGRTLDIYASNTAYTAAGDLYSTSTSGTKVTSFKYTKGTTVTSTYTFADDYKYIGIRSASGALYIDSIEIVWESVVEGGGETVTKEVYSNSDFRFRVGVDAAIADIENVDSYGIKVTAGGKTAYYTVGAKSWTNDGEYCYVTILLGDIINNPEKLKTDFTVCAYVEVDGINYESEQTTTYSVVSIIAYYCDNLGIAEVEHLYDYLANNDLI